MNILLAGATGAIGRLLLPQLVQAGHEVFGTTRHASKTDQILAAGGKPVVLDVLDRKETIAALERVRPDTIIHQLTDLSQRDFAANSRLRIEGMRNLVDAALAVGVQRMIAQSISWIYVPHHAPAAEDEALDLASPPPRGRTVAAVHALEQAVAEVPVGIVLRYGVLYGPGTWYARDGLITEQVRRGELEANDGLTSFVHVADAARAAMIALGWPAGAYNIVDDEPATGKYWLGLYATLVGAPQPRVKSGAANWERGASNAKARQQGWRPQYPSWRDGFKSELTSRAH